MFSASTVFRSAAFGGLAVLIAAAFAVVPASAAEEGQSPYIKGYRDIFMGVVPPQTGLYFRTDLIYYGGQADTAVLGGLAQFGVRESAGYVLPAFTYVTDIKILGGQYAFNAVPSLLIVDARADFTGARGRVGVHGGGDMVGIGDSVITPLILGWHGHNDTHWNVGLSAVLPTGSYEVGRLQNTSLGYYAIIPQAGWSYLNPKTGWDASVGAAYVFPFKHEATDYQTGQILHFDAALSKAVSPAWRLGVVGYAMIQTTDDTGTGAVLGGFHSQVFGMGPLAAYSLKIEGKPVTMLMKWDHEFGASNTFHGDTVTAALSLKF